MPNRRLSGAFLFVPVAQGAAAQEQMLSKASRSRLLVMSVVLQVCLCGLAQEPARQSLDRQYQAAVADFESGRFEQTITTLEPVLPYATQSFEVHELIGLAYASLGQQSKAEDHLKLAVQLAPTSAAARTNFGTCLLHGHKLALSAEQFKRALQLEPESFDANHNLGELYVQMGKITEAQPLLLKAQRLNAKSYENGYDLVLADFTLGKLDEARGLAQTMLATQNSPELHNLLQQISEKDGRFVDAAKEVELAAHLDPSEDNLFDWGCEMLLHRTYDPAIAIFQNATGRYPKSPRMFIGLGLANYFRGQYDEAVKALLRATDLDPNDPRASLFLSKAYDSSPTQADNVIDHFHHFAELQPSNAKAQYYYAISLWKGKRAAASSADLATVETLLKKAIALDDSLTQAHVQLGDLYSGEHLYEKAIPEYVRALALDSNLSDAHYRLGTDLVHVGKKDEAQKEFDIYQKLRAQHLAELDKERAEVRQFVYSEKGSGNAKP